MRIALAGKRTPLRLLGFAALWTAIGLFFSLQVYVDYQYAGRKIDLGQAVFLGLTDWYLWGLFFPLILFVARRARIDRGVWLRSLLIHLPFTLILAVVKSGVERVFVAALAPQLLPPQSITRLNAALLTCWLLVVASHALLHNQTARDRLQRSLRLEAELSQAQLQLLRMQLQPHFLFNTLHSIGTLMHRDVAAAETMLTQLSDLLRATLDNADRQFVTLKQELEFAQLYLEIQQTRFGDRLRVSFAVDPDALDAPMPNMILQPLIENAIAHGIAKRTDGGTISIRAAIRGSRLVVEIGDDGPGLPVGAAPEERIGLSNTRSRLAQLYADEHELSLQSSPSGGLRVTLSLPSEPHPPDT